jgi:hypothetical protein
MTESQSGIQLSPSDSQHLYIRDGYFGEVGQMWPGNTFHFYFCSANSTIVNRSTILLRS